MDSYENELARRLSQEQFSLQVLDQKYIDAKIEEEALFNERLNRAKLNYSELVNAAYNTINNYDLPSYPIAWISSNASRKKMGICREAGRLVLAEDLGLAYGLLFERANFSIIKLDKRNIINDRWVTYRYVPNNIKTRHSTVAFNPHNHLGENIIGDENGRPIIIKGLHNRDSGEDVNYTFDVEEFVMSNIVKAIANLNRQDLK